nr:MAG TPA: Regulatory protein-modification, helix-turn-helix, transcriptional regulator, DNA [Caudoviricetes sp.]
MKFADALKEMIHRAKLTQKGLAEKAGYKTLSSVTTPIARGDIKLSTLCRLANSAGYDVMLVRRDAIEPEYPIKIEYSENAK